jgi:HlyD family secretion protein
MSDASLPLPAPPSASAARIDYGAGIRRAIVWGFVLILTLFVGFGAWAAMARIHGAIIAFGVVVVDGNSKRVQHRDGGTVAALMAREGQTVNEGDVLLRLDDVAIRAELGIVRGTIVAQESRRSRLVAERDGATELTPSATLAALLSDPEAAETFAAERRLFEARRRTREGVRTQLGERVSQIRQEVLGLTAQQRAKTAETELTQRELDDLMPLFRAGNVSLQRINQLRRSLIALEGESGALMAELARARARIAEVETQQAQIERELQTEVSRDLRDALDRLAEANERRIASEDRLRRVEVRAPANGIVHQLTAHTIGGVVAPGEQIMLIVPGEQRLIVEVRADPTAIDQMRVGQDATVRLTAFDQRLTPEATGRVMRISADLETDQRSGMQFYKVLVEIPPEELQRLGNLRLLPGMPAEAHLQTTDRTVAYYFLKPITDQFVRAFRER